ncbi:hypothetical protein [Desulfonatronum lacustre]|uniref:hypothetical protein n=1 Tax=Desulfonatronum lacustre TaxID=66849 RepID=UPI00049051FC|nr:hypothetical protein [Desulfonatronum lacustre]SMP39360.1 hypothetical protein SAMN06295888_101243 [Desulfonatronum zhilinae]
MRLHASSSPKITLHPTPAVIILLALITVYMPIPAAADQTADQASSSIPEFIPRTIAGMELVELIDGRRAAAIINRMHHGDVATQANYIAEYKGPPGSATYYVSLYDDPRRVVTDMEEMAEIMAKEGHGFSHLMPRVKNDVVFYMALGQGQAHYFFARDLELVWLAVDVDVAELAIEDVL